MTDKELVQAWYTVARGVTDGIANNAVAVLVLTETYVRRKGPNWKNKLVNTLNNFRRDHLRLAVAICYRNLGRDRVNRLNKTQLIGYIVKAFPE